MQLLIDIPEKTVNEIKDNALFKWSISSDIRWDVTNAIVNGIPLEKIRGEIKQMPTISWNANDIYKADVLAIIDKCRESEEE